MNGKFFRMSLSPENKNMIKGLLFISPWLIGFLLWAVYPIAASFYYSLTRYDLINPPRFIGLSNYDEMFFHDEIFGKVAGNTIYYVGLGVPIGIVVAFLLASLLNTEIQFRSAFRAIFFIPSIVPAIVSAMVWDWVLNTQYGLIDSLLVSMGIKAVPWLSSPALAKPTLIIIYCWAQGSAIVIFLAALQDVPRSLYDAALVDGANWRQRFWHVTIPMCTPSILFALITGFIGGFQTFTLPWLLTEGGPYNATEFFGIYLYRNAFNFMKMGYAASLAWILFILIVIFTILFFRSSARWVYYGGG
ncbi:MAG: sugar ABC transporter permease [Chloroflexota bacterium]|nr:sugar ABC transporter permease [Chloroflexota bacterium]